MSNTEYNNLKKIQEIYKNNSKKVAFTNFSFLLDKNFNDLLNYFKFYDKSASDLSKLSNDSIFKESSKNLDCYDFFIMKLKKYPFNGYNQDTTHIELYIDQFIDNLLALISLNLDKTGSNLLFYELLINIYIHSQFDNAYVLCLNIQDSNNVAIVIMDDGITIPRSLETSGYSFKNDSNAIFGAIDGYSSDKYEDGIMGRGLNMSASISSLAFGEDLLIASKKGISIVKGDIVYNFHLSDLCIDGTLICLKLNNIKIKNIYEYVNRFNFKKIDVLE